MPASSFANRAGQRNRSAGASSVKSGIKDDLRQQGESEQLSNPAHRTASEPRKTDYIPIYQEHCSSERGQGEDLHASNISSAGEFLPAEGTHSHPSPAGRTIRLNQYGHELDGQFDWAVDKSKRMIKELPRRSLAGHLGSPPSINRDAEDVPLGLVERRVHASRGSGETLGDLPNLIQDLRVSSSSLLTARHKVAGMLVNKKLGNPDSVGTISTRGSTTSASSACRSSSGHRDSDQESTSLPNSETEGEIFTEGVSGRSLSRSSPAKSLSPKAQTSPLPKDPQALLAELTQALVPAMAASEARISVGMKADEEAPAAGDAASVGKEDGIATFRFDIPEAMRTNPMTDPLFHARMITRMSAPTFSAITELQEAVERTHVGMVRLDARQSSLADGDSSAAPSSRYHHHQADQCEHELDNAGDSCGEDDCDCRDDGAYSTGGNNKKRKSARHGMDNDAISGSTNIKDSVHGYYHGGSAAAQDVERRAPVASEVQGDEADIDDEDELRIVYPSARMPHSAMQRLNLRNFVKIKFRAFRAVRARAKAREQEEAERLEKEKEEASAAAVAAAARKKRTSKAEKKAQAFGKSGGTKKMTLAEIKVRLQGQQGSENKCKDKPKDEDEGDAKSSSADNQARDEKPSTSPSIHTIVSVPSLSKFEYSCQSESTTRLVTMRKEIDNMQSTLSESLRPIDDAVAAATDALARIDAGDPNAAASAAAALAAARAALPEQYMRSVTGAQAQWNKSFVNPAAETVTSNLAKTISATASKLAPLLSVEDSLQLTSPNMGALHYSADTPAGNALSIVPLPVAPSKAQQASFSPVSTLAPEATSGAPMPLPVSAPSYQDPAFFQPGGSAQSRLDAGSPMNPQTQSPPLVQNGSKVSRRKKANMNNVHHKSNYVPSRTPSEPPRHQRGSVNASGVPAGCLDHPSTSNPLFPDEWVCLFCDYELLYGEPPLMLRAIKNRKKIAATRKRAQARAHRAAMGKPSTHPSTSPRPLDHHHDEDGSEGGSSVARCECGNPLCYEDDSGRGGSGT